MQNANKPENRLKHPWIITFGHNPMYCSNKVDSYCTVDDEIVRNGIPILNKLVIKILRTKYNHIEVSYDFVLMRFVIDNSFLSFFSNKKHLLQL